ncbi:hypothetical protein MMC30_004660 [Trapelia coarctata]|nr:hypothetical protein [Trapelia coarctata]
MTTKPPSLGNLVRLVPLTLHELPDHAAFANLPPPANPSIRKHNAEGSSSSDSSKPSQKSDHSTSNRPRFQDFISAILLEADHFVETTLPRTFISTSTTKTSKPALAKVELLKRMIRPKELAEVPWDAGPVPRRSVNKKALEKGKGSGEAWFARRSKHANQSEEGTADWPEFDEGLRVDHSEKERMYTPNVYDSFRVLDWDEQTRAVEFEGGWRQVDMRSKQARFRSSQIAVLTTVYEMAHSLPFPLKPRVFPTLVITASLPCRANGAGHIAAPCFDPHHPTALLVVQIPINITDFPLALYSSSRNVREGSTTQKRKKVVLGRYTSVEKCTFLPDLNIQWVMATASDAKGWLPMWMQKLGVPGAVMKDVGLFVDWVKGKRRSSADYPVPDWMEGRTGLGRKTEQLFADLVTSVDAKDEKLLPRDAIHKAHNKYKAWQTKSNLCDGEKGSTFSTLGRRNTIGELMANLGDVVKWVNSTCVASAKMHAEPEQEQSLTPRVVETEEAVETEQGLADLNDSKVFEGYVKNLGDIISKLENITG